VRKFLKKLTLFATPFAICVAIVVMVDPFNFFNWFHVVPNSVKKPISNLHYPFWKMSEFSRNPSPNILLGDSRMGSIRSELVEEITGRKYYNFSYGGGTLPEIINTFWYADSQATLQNVYIGINFNLYNALESRDRTEDYRNIVRNPLLYFVNPTVIKATFFDLQAACGRRIEVGAPPMDHDRFWQYQLDVIASGMYRNYKYPSSWKQELDRIASHCRAKGINLVFVMFPTHIDLQQQITNFRLNAQRDQFARDLTALAPTIDFDLPSAVTSDPKNFKDPFHFTEQIMELLVQDIWGGKTSLPCSRTPMESLVQVSPN
jgi:hypothetical protein